MADRQDPGELGAFLKACRAQVRPEDLGLISYGGRRRVAGLRREELAQLAGVSPSYYARLEQGQSRHASPQVLDAIAAALDLTAPEREHLHALTVTQQTLRSIERPDQTLVTCTTPAGSASAEALTMPAHVAYPAKTPRPRCQRTDIRQPSVTI